jgi:hypothetical protein
MRRPVRTHNATMSRGGYICTTSHYSAIDTKRQHRTPTRKEQRTGGGKGSFVTNTRACARELVCKLQKLNRFSRFACCEMLWFPLPPCGEGGGCRERGRLRSGEEVNGGLTRVAADPALSRKSVNCRARSGAVRTETPRGEFPHIHRTDTIRCQRYLKISVDDDNPPPATRAWGWAKLGTGSDVAAEGRGVRVALLILIRLGPPALNARRSATKIGQSVSASPGSAF